MKNIHANFDRINSQRISKVSIQTLWVPGGGVEGWLNQKCLLIISSVTFCFKLVSKKCPFKLCGPLGVEMGFAGSLNKISCDIKMLKNTYGLKKISKRIWILKLKDKYTLLKKFLIMIIQHFL